MSEVLASGMLVQGDRVAAFERALAERCGRTHAVVCGSGTAALELALEALEVRSGEVLCPDLSWPSPAHAVARSGARVALVDVDRATWVATAEGFSRARTRETRAAIAIDQFGMPADHEAIANSLEGVPLIVDAACSIGSTLRGRPAPAGGTIACLSFHPRKVITTGEGGACLTDDAALAERLRVLRNHGQAAPGRFVAAAGNQRLGEVSAAMGCAQLERLDEILARRRELARRYREQLPSWLEVQQETPGASSNWQTFGVCLPVATGAHQRDRVVAELRERGVEAGRLSYALHKLGSLSENAMAEGSVAGDSGAGDSGVGFPEAERLDTCGLALPLHPLMNEDEQHRVTEALLEVAETMELGR